MQSNILTFEPTHASYLSCCIVICTSGCSINALSVPRNACAKPLPNNSCEHCRFSNRSALSIAMSSRRTFCSKGTKYREIRRIQCQNYLTRSPHVPALQLPLLRRKNMTLTMGTTFASNSSISVPRASLMCHASTRTSNLDSIEHQKSCFETVNTINPLTCGRLRAF